MENNELNLEELYEKILSKINSSDENSYTRKLVADKELLKRKLIEEAAEVITSKNKEELIWECADLLYFLLVFMAEAGITLDDVYKENERRDKETLINKENLTKSLKEENNKETKTTW
jgi:phosphoribosyl-ATP pyrophosphohydrolase